MLDSIPTETLLIFTNELRDKVGVAFGNPDTTVGGHAMRFYSSYRL
jgi:recombination protein RecA